MLSCDQSERHKQRYFLTFSLIIFAQEQALTVCCQCTQLMSHPVLFSASTHISPYQDYV